MKCLGEFIRYATERGYELTPGDNPVQRLRPAKGGQFYLDAVHSPKSLHYNGLALDLNLFVNGEYIRNSDHEAWQDLGSFWLSLDPLCRWGGTFSEPDANHLSVTWQGMA